MSDMGEMYRAWDTYKNDRRQLNTKNVATRLADAGIKFE